MWGGKEDFSSQDLSHLYPSPFWPKSFPLLLQVYGKKQRVQIIDYIQKGTDLIQVFSRNLQLLRPPTRCYNILASVSYQKFIYIVFESAIVSISNM